MRQTHTSHMDVRPFILNCANRNCSNVGSKKCSICKTRYCSKACQKQDWPTHKEQCKSDRKPDVVIEGKNGSSRIRKSTNWEEINSIVIIPGSNCDKSGKRSVLRILEDLEGSTEIVTYGYEDFAIPFECKCSSTPCKYELDFEEFENKKNQRKNNH